MTHRYTHFTLLQVETHSRSQLVVVVQEQVALVSIVKPVLSGHSKEDEK